MSRLKEPHQLKGFGRVVTGSVFDCNKRGLEKSLQFYDKQLYIKWNPDKKGGKGCWEVRRRPDIYSRVYHGDWNGQKVFTSELVEIDIVHHVLDIDVLHQDVLGRIKRMDTWNARHWVDDLEYDEKKFKEKSQEKAKQELSYNIKQHKREWREFAQLVSSGVNPAEVLKRIKNWD